MQLWGKLHKFYYIVYIIFEINSNGYMLQCGGNGWRESTEMGVWLITDTLPKAQPGIA